MFCNAGVNWFIIKPNGDYARCYSEFNKQDLRNIIKDKEIYQLSFGEMICPYNIACHQGCRTDCDFARTTRFNPENDFKSEAGHNYLLTKIDNIFKIKKNEAEIFWHLTNLCNYSCIYCNYPFTRSVDTLLPGEIGEGCVDIVNILLEKFDNLHIVFSGGEPTIHPYFMNIIKKLYENLDKSTVTIISNMSMFEKLKEVFSWNWKYKLTVNASCHFSDPRFDLDSFTEICLLGNKVADIRICTVDHPHERRYFNDYLSYFKILGFKGMYHQYYEPSRKRTDKFQEDFIPKSYERLKFLLNNIKTNLF